MVRGEDGGVQVPQSESWASELPYFTMAASGAALGSKTMDRIPKAGSSRTMSGTLLFAKIPNVLLAGQAQDSDLDRQNRDAQAV